MGTLICSLLLYFPADLLIQYMPEQEAEIRACAQDTGSGAEEDAVGTEPEKQEEGVGTGVAQ